MGTSLNVHGHPTQIGQYIHFDDARAFDFPPVRRFDASGVKTYHDNSGVKFWFDPERFRVVTDVPGLFVQLVSVINREQRFRALLLGIDGLRIQFAGPDGASLPFEHPKDANGAVQFTIAGIGAPLCYHTGAHDLQIAHKRPLAEMYQILTNASGFPDRATQDRALGFLRDVIAAYGDIFQIDPWYGREKPGVLVFENTLQQRIAGGEFLNA